MNDHMNNLSNHDLSQMCRDLSLIGDNSSQISTLSQRAKDSAEHGLKALTDVQSTLTSFVDSSYEINSLLDQINLLSRQVHILGMNAAVEAANAGDQGAGFTIIAEEMRRIAGHVKETTNSVQSILEVSGTLADDTVAAIETATENLEVLEISADLSVELNNVSAEKSTFHKGQLENALNIKTEIA